MHPSLKEIGDQAAAEAERQAIRVALQVTQGNKNAAARLLRVDYKTLHLKMKHYAIEARRRVTCARTSRLQGLRCDPAEDCP